MKISIVQPSRNNLRYLKWSYESIRKNQGDHEVWICVADDASTDGTAGWCMEMRRKDPYFKWLRNITGKRKGHTILYDQIIRDLVETDIAMIYHADMYLCPGALDAIERHMYETINVKINNVGIQKIKNKKTIVSLTRIEPPLHPEGPEKILANFGVEPEEFNENDFLEWFDNTGFDVHFIEDSKVKSIRETQTTEGIFAPWAFWVEDFKEIGGHDELYAPQSKEDSDIFNRFQLYGVKFIQTWEGFVYHMTCRGSRRNTEDKATDIYTDSPEWLAQNERSTRNFIRKWGSFVKHDQYMKPIIPHKYNIGFYIENLPECSPLIKILEPWCTDLYCDIDTTFYWQEEQKNTLFDLGKKLRHLNDQLLNDVIVYIDAFTFNDTQYNIIQHLPEILDDAGDIKGSFQVDGLRVEVNRIEHYDLDLIENERSCIHGEKQYE